MSHGERARILIVDDEQFYIDLLVNLLSDDYDISIAINGEQALKRVKGKAHPDLILLDVMMPQMDGYEVCRQLKEDPMVRSIPVIFLTAMNNADDEIKGLTLGAVDYITKPITAPVLLSRVRNHLSLSEQRFALEALVLERTKELERIKEAVIYCLGAIAEKRDTETAKHVLRTSRYIQVLLDGLTKTEKYQKSLNQIVINKIVQSAPLHDIGKVGVPDRILQKPGLLTDEERGQMQLHVKYGRDAINNTKQYLGVNPFLKIAKEIIYYHHERWDGMGYLEGLKGDEIPLSARVMALADVYDAMVSKRYYKDEIDHATVVDYIKESSGGAFDPDVVQVFVENHDAFKMIHRQLKDEDYG